MRHQHYYSIPDLADYINWPYLYHAWGIPSGEKAETKRLQSDARLLLSRMTSHTTVKAAVCLLPCHSDGDDIVLHLDGQTAAKQTTDCTLRLPMLRQQHPDSTGHCLCLADFIRPEGCGETDTIGLFATTVSAALPSVDNYAALLAQTLADRLAEAAAERFHEEVRKTLWGYAPDETLDMDAMHAGHFQGIRPAVGYPSLPDLSLNFLLDRVLNFADIGITLTEHGMMQPHASVSGLMFSHAAARYFSVGTISEEQLHDYALRRALPVDTVRTYLSANLQH